MVAPLLYSTDCCWRSIGSFDDLGSPVGRFTTSEWIGVGSAVFDAIAVLACCIIGIIGATSVISMPAVASYALIILSGAIILSWIAMFAHIRYNAP